MFKSGTLLASYQGVSATWQGITIEYPPSGPQPEGRYVLLQQNKNQILEVRNIGASFEGKPQNFIRSIGKYDDCPTLSYYEYAVIISIISPYCSCKRHWSEVGNGLHPPGCNLPWPPFLNATDKNIKKGG